MSRQSLSRRRGGRPRPVLPLYADDAVRTQRSRGYPAARLHQKMDQARLESGDLLSHASDANLRRPTSGSRWTNPHFAVPHVVRLPDRPQVAVCGDTVIGDAVSAGDPDAPTAQARLPSV
jgi:hypothetical protein